ncbi:phosphotransferase [Novosphingobium sp. G106]|uniref:phosphotransferase n=1 Tax=Novosphingobium sp. G106 TaxID=2849500 RepID=UPI001C2D947E|nr:phosphotransferase [Novosphingobium sp. G106]MBV1687903.1 phosphotransferase [Novosphingobium sp. G106]
MDDRTGPAGRRSRRFSQRQLLQQGNPGVMEHRLAHYLTAQMPGVDDVEVYDLARIYGGSSQETFRFRARWTQDGQNIERSLILRRDAAAGLVVAERDLEYTVYKALAGQGIPIPAVYFLELDSQWLERPFFIMDLCPGKPGNPYGAGDPYDGHGEEVGRHFWTIMGRLAAIDHRAVGLDRLRNGNESKGFWSLELDRWEAILDEGEGGDRTHRPRSVTLAAAQPAARASEAGHCPW